MKKAMWLFAVSVFKIALLTILIWLVWGVLAFVTASVLWGVSSLACAGNECTEIGFDLVIPTFGVLGAEFVATSVIVAWVLGRFEKRSEKSKRKEKPSLGYNLTNKTAVMEQVEINL